MSISIPLPVNFSHLTNANGVATVSVDGRLLYSRYDPHKHAKRWAGELSLARGTRWVLLVGDLLGYGAAALTELHPEVGIIAIKPTDARSHGETHTVTGDRPDRIRAQLRAVLPYRALSSVEAVTWPPARTALPRWSERAERAVVAAVADRRSELATTAAFGKLWLHNALRRSLEQPTRSEIRVRHGDLIVVGAGASLAQLPRSGWTGAGVLAASSAIASLHAIGCAPAIALHLDGGVWAQRYLHTIARAAPTATVVLGLKASRGPARSPVLIRSDWFGEAVAPDAVDWPFVPERPSVGLTLLDLRVGLGCTRPARTAGLDFCSYDLRSHAPNHHNERSAATAASRLAPRYHRLFERTAVDTRRLATPWPDGAPAYTTTVLDLFRAEFARTHSDALPIAAVPELSRAPAPLDRTSARPAELERRVLERPAARRRADHARNRIGVWHEMLRERERGRIVDELELHLAPVEFVRGDRDATGRAALAEVTALQRYVARWAERCG